MTGLPPPGMILVRHLGRGRLGATALCRDSAGAEVVVTALEATPTDAILRRQLEAEIGAAAAAFDHPCAVTPRLLSGQGHQMYLVQPYLAGGALGSDSVPADEAVVGAVRLIAALAQAQSAGMLHGDIRPANVLRTSDGAWVLSGGGVLHAVGRLSPGAVSPDSLFAAPEYFGGESLGAAADVYGLGATLYAALVGHAPHVEAAGESTGSLYAARLGVPPELPLAVPAVLASLIARMLASDPAERPALTEVDHVLRSIAPTVTQLPPPPSAQTLAPPPRPVVRLAVTEPAAIAAAGRQRTLVAGIAIGALFLAGAGAVAASNGGEDPGTLVAATASPGLGQTSAPVVPTPASATPVAKAGNTAAATIRAGLAPAQTALFMYKGRLTLVWVMNAIASDLARFDLYSIRRDGSGRTGPFTGNIGERPLPGARKVLVYFFELDPPPKPCVRIVAVTRSGSKVPDNRTTCVTKPPATLRDYAADVYEDFLRQQQTMPAPDVKRT